MPDPVLILPDRRGGVIVHHDPDHTRGVRYPNPEHARHYAMWRAGFHEGCEVHIYPRMGPPEVITAAEIARSAVGG